MSVFEYADRHPWWSLVFLLVLAMAANDIARAVGRGLARRGRT